MHIPRTPHRWRLTPSEAVTVQSRFAQCVVRQGDGRPLRRIAGLDAAFHGSTCVAAVVLWDVERRAVQEQHVASHPLWFPYVPGLLSFREAPALLAALRKLEGAPDALMCDGQGIAHPRRFGIASHLGVLTGLPSIGCAKSRLTGDALTPGPARGDTAPLTDRGEVVGAVVRTRSNTRPVYVSTGHLVDLPSAVALTRSRVEKANSYH